MGFCDDYSDDEMDVEELERRIWRDKMKLKRLKEMNKSKEGDGSQQGQSQEQARRIYTCGFVQCPHRKLGLGFEDRLARDNHQLTCPHRNSARFGVSDFHMNEVEPVVFTQPFVQPKAATVTVAAGTSTAAVVIVAAPPVNPSPPSLNLSGLDIPEDGKRMINDLVSFYDTNIQGNKSI